VISIRTLAKIGPWTFTGIDYTANDSTVKCQRCPKQIKQIYCLSVDARPEVLRELGLVKDWRIGNECGPQLIANSHALWAGAAEFSPGDWDQRTKNAESWLRLAKRLDRVLAVLPENDDIREKFVRCRAALLDGSIGVKKAWLGAMVAQRGREFDLWK